MTLVIEAGLLLAVPPELVPVELVPVVLPVLVELPELQAAIAVAARQLAATATIALDLRPRARRAALRTSIISHSPLNTKDSVNDQILPAANKPRSGFTVFLMAEARSFELSTLSQVR
ncbi:MAG TPA: hypothetical protein VGM12_33405 [Trebonia sp.]